jgi:thiol:disulfide interchange protein DsbD
VLKYITTIIFVLIVSTVWADSQEEMGSVDEILRGRIILPAEALAKQNSYTILVELNISKGWHINSNQPLEEFLIPTEIKFQDIEGVSFGKIHYQKPELVDFSFSDTKVSVYEGKSYARTTITITPDFADEDLVIRANIDYQACNDQSCLAPTSVSVTKLVTILEAGSNIIPQNQEVFDKAAPHFEENTGSDDQEMGNVLRSSGLLYSLIFIYLGGLALNLTPCVYPLIPITISYFGGQGEGNKGAITARAILYVVGMAVTYSILGMVAALTGSLLGSALQNPLVLIFIALVLLGLALSMFGVYEIRVPQSLALIGGKNRSGYLGTFLMGLTVGLIAAPCIGPFVLGLLTYVGELGDPFLGFLMFFVLALGLGTPFLLLGIFSGAAASLPRSGAWMVWVRILFGFVLIGMAIYFLEPLFPTKGLYYYTLAILAIISGIYLGWIDKNSGKTGFKIARNIVGVLFIIIGIFIAWPTETQAEGGILWQSYQSELLIKAKNEQKPVIMDFYADWCIPCKELDKFTFSDSRVIEASSDFVTLKVDLTSFQSEETSKLREKYSIKGVPTILFLSASGEEISELRLSGYEDADKFLQRLSKIP